MQCGPKPLSGKIDKVPNLLRHETAYWIDNTNRNRVALEFGKDGGE